MTGQDELVLLAYTSAAKIHFEHDDLLEILSKARIRNEASGITGLLLYVEGNFFQVIEGPRSQVDALFARVCKDSRHGHFLKIIEEPITERNFGHWSMGFAGVSREELTKIPGIGM